jgi:hypothetical protein
MGMYISKHEHGWSPDLLKEQFDFGVEDLDDALLKVSKKPDNLSSLLNSAIDYAGYVSVLEPSSSELYRALNIAAHATRCIFLLADLSITEEYDLSVGEGDPFRFRQTGPTSYSNSPRWQQGFYLAAACREAPILDSLVARSTEIMLHPRASQGVDKYVHPMVDTLKSLYTNPTSETMAKLTVALEATDPERIRADMANFSENIQEEAMDYVLDIAVPEMELLLRIMEQDADKFNASLAKALELHKKHWSSKERRSDPRGFIALAPLGLACIAHDLGIPIEVESEYIPKYILEKQFLADLQAEKVVHYREPQITQIPEPEELSSEVSAAISEINELIPQYERAREERYSLEEIKYSDEANFTQAQQQELSAIIREVFKYLRKIAQRGAEIYIRRNYPTALLEYGLPDLGNRSRVTDFHQVWRIPITNNKDQDLYIVIAAIGGGSALGYMKIGDLQYSEGTPQYFDEVVRRMSQSQDSPEAQRVATQLQTARKNRGVRYLEVRTHLKLDGQGNGTIGDVEVQEFDLSFANV